MTREYLKKATLTSASGASDVHDTVVSILDDIKAGGDASAMEYAAKFDQYEGNVLWTQAEIEAASASNLKRTWVNNGLATDWDRVKTDEVLNHATETRTIWIPYGE